MYSYAYMYNPDSSGCDYTFTCLHKLHVYTRMAQELLYRAIKVLILFFFTVLLGDLLSEISSPLLRVVKCSTDRMSWENRRVGMTRPPESILCEPISVGGRHKCQHFITSQYKTCGDETCLIMNAPLAGIPSRVATKCTGSMKWQVGGHLYGVFPVHIGRITSAVLIGQSALSSPLLWWWV